MSGSKHGWKTLYHGSTSGTVSQVRDEGLRKSTNGTLGPGVYFVEEYYEAKKIAEHRTGKIGQKAVVYKCLLNLGKQIDLDKHVERKKDWHQDYDSATALHLPWWMEWNGIENEFREYCLKDSCKSLVISTFVNDLLKNEENSSEEELSEHDVVSVQINLASANKDNNNEAVDETASLTPDDDDDTDGDENYDVSTLSREKNDLKNVINKFKDTKNFHCPKNKHRWPARRWYIMVKILLMLLNTANGVWSLVNLFSVQNYDMEGALASFAVFFTFLSIARIMFVIFHCFAGKPGKLCLTLFVCKLSMTILFEMPMLVSQVHVLKKIQNITWSKYSWDIALHIQFITNLVMFLLFDFALHFRKKSKKWLSLTVLGVLLLLLCIAGALFVPVYVTQHGWKMIPNMSDFDGSLEDGDIVTGMLKFTMYMGAAGLWLGCFVLSFIAVIGIGVFILKIPHQFKILKVILMLFESSNGIYSLVHLFSEQNDDMSGALVSFAVFFTFLSIARIFYGCFVFLSDSDGFDKDLDTRENLKALAIPKICMALFLEMPMLVSQAFALNKIPNIVWSKFTWDVTLQVQFHVNAVLFTMLFLCNYVKNDFENPVCGSNTYDHVILQVLIGIPILLFYFATMLIVASPVLLVSAILFAPVHLTQLDWNLLPKISDFGGSLDHGTIVTGLLAFSMYMGCIGLWIWTIVLGIISLAILIAICSLCICKRTDYEVV